MEKLPVIMLNLNTIEVTEQCVDHLHRYTDRSAIHIFVVDNGSTDPADFPRLQEMLSQHRIDQLSRNDRNLGFALGCNLAVPMTRSDVFCLMNNDCLVEEGWLTAAWRTFQSEEGIAVVCSNIYNEVSRRNPLDDQPIEQVVGGIMLIRRTMWEATGGFDHKNFSPGYGEELDWSARAARKGYRFKLSGRSLAHHLGSYTMKKNFDPDAARVLRLAHRIKFRCFNWSVRKLFLASWKMYWEEILYEIRHRSVHLLLLAFLKNLAILPTIWAERRKRLSGG